MPLDTRSRPRMRRRHGSRASAPTGRAARDATRDRGRGKPTKKTKTGRGDPPPPPAGGSYGGQPGQAHPLPPLPPRTRELLQFKLKSRYRGGDGGCLDASKVLKLLSFYLALLQMLE